MLHTVIFWTSSKTQWTIKNSAHFRSLLENKISVSCDLAIWKSLLLPYDML